jgi:amidohydrolase
MLEALKADVAALSHQLIDWRRDFHRHPEVAFQEHRTSAVIKQFLEESGIPVRSIAGTGLVGEVRGKTGGRTIALRADIDALPLAEEGKEGYASLNHGACHACGHDGHMAILMAAARLLVQRKSDFCGRLVLLFQPSEERIPGGAMPMIKEGALDGVDAVFGLHLWQTMPTGTVGCVKGAMMAASDEFSIQLTGRGGHCSMPHLSIDPITAAGNLIVNLNSIVSRNVDPLKPAVLSLGTIHGGVIHNIIPNEVTLTGTVRTFDPQLRDLMEKRIREVVAGTSNACGIQGELQYVRGYPALVNDAAMAELVLSVARRTLGESKVIEIAPVMGGEDFAYYLQKVPGAFLFFGMGDGTGFPHHHPRFDMDEKALAPAALLMTALALQYLGESIR